MIVRMLGALGIGALAMYFFDPVTGRRRRALLRERLGNARSNRVHGLAAEARGTSERRQGQRRQGSTLDVDPAQP